MSKCPICHKELLPFGYEGIELLRCTACDGFWFRSGKFREVKQVGFAGLSSENSAESPAVAEQPELMCPDCPDPLIPYTYAYSSDIQLHRCTRCHGIWATSTDLRRIEELLANYKESLNEAKARVLPLMLKVKKQIQQKERVREEEEQKRKKHKFFNRLFGKKSLKNHEPRNIFEDNDHDNDD